MCWLLPLSVLLVVGGLVWVGVCSRLFVLMCWWSSVPIAGCQWRSLPFVVGCNGLSVAGWDSCRLWCVFVDL